LPLIVDASLSNTRGHRVIRCRGVEMRSKSLGRTPCLGKGESSRAVFTKAALAAASRETLHAWFHTFELYALEYGYSQDLLIASHYQLGAIVEAHYPE
jgi:hypothetical protein